MRFTDRLDAARRLATLVADHLSTLPGAKPPAAAGSAPGQASAAIPVAGRPGEAGPAAGRPDDAGSAAGGPGTRPLILGLPRGGVPMAAVVAREVGGDLDLVVARKIGAPGHPEFGIGAVAGAGEPIFDLRSLDRLGLAPHDLAPDVDRERAEVARRLAAYRGARPSPPVAGRVVVLVDDGLATGVTALAAVRGLRAEGPAHLAVAVPVCTPEARDLLSREADAVLCLHCPADFRAVGAYYDDFTQLTDADVHAALTSIAR